MLIMNYFDPIALIGLNTWFVALSYHVIQYY